MISFLEDHPGGAKAILLYAGREATEEFEMVHPANTLQKHAKHIGTFLSLLPPDNILISSHRQSQGLVDQLSRKIKAEIVTHGCIVEGDVCVSSCTCCLYLLFPMSHRPMICILYRSILASPLHAPSNKHDSNDVLYI